MAYPPSGSRWETRFLEPISNGGRELRKKQMGKNST